MNDKLLAAIEILDLVDDHCLVVGLVDHGQVGYITIEGEGNDDTCVSVAKVVDVLTRRVGHIAKDEFLGVVCRLEWELEQRRNVVEPDQPSDGRGVRTPVRIDTDQ